MLKYFLNSAWNLIKQPGNRIQAGVENEIKRANCFFRELKKPVNFVGILMFSREDKN